MGKRVLILGAGKMQIPAITLAKKNGWFAAAADGNPLAEGSVLADEFRPIDLKDIDGLLAFAEDIRSRGGLDGVFTVGTDFSYSVARIAEFYRLPGHSAQAALNATDKALMRRRFAANGVPSPGFFEAASESEALRSARGVRFPLVVKPVDNMGARGCSLARASEELSAAVASALSFSRAKRVIVESYADGGEFSLDALVYEGEIHIAGFADRHIRFLPYFVEMGHTIPTNADKIVKERVIGAFKAGIDALGLTHGAAKGDIKYTADGPVVVEIAARLSGGYMSGWTYPYSSGCDAIAAALRLAVGEPPDIGVPSRSYTAAERAWISIPGRIDSVSLPKKTGAVKEIFSRVQAGDEAVFPSNNVEKCGNAIAAAPKSGDAVAAAESVCAQVFIRLKPRGARTDSFLSRGLTEPDGYPPNAFILPSEILEELAAAPRFIGSKEGELALARAPQWLAPYDFLSDYNHRALKESAVRAAELTGIRFYSVLEAQSLEVCALYGSFWRALIRGGIQAAVYIVDCLKAGVKIDALPL